MALQKRFKSSYIKVLKEQAKSVDAPALYAAEKFLFDETMTKELPFETPDGLCKKLLDANDNFEAAVAIYEAYPDLTPILATFEEFWVYLIHVDLFPYVQKLWPELKTGKASSSYILDHCFHSPNGTMRTTIEGLWWLVYLSVDIARGEDNKYDLTKFLLSNVDFSTRRFGPSKLIRHKEAMIGVLEFLIEEPEISKENFEPHFIYITKYLNRIGGVKKLAFIDR